MNIDRWLYKISKMIKKCARHVNTSEVSYHGHKMVRARASAIATSKGLGTALLIAPPVLILIAAGIAASSTVHAPPPVDSMRTPNSTPLPSITPAKRILSGIQAQLQSIATVEKRQDHTTTVAVALIAMGFIGVALAIRTIRNRGRGGGGRGKNAAGGEYGYPNGMNNVYREVHVRTASQLYEENPTLNAGSGGDPFQPR
ncbi:unnamed protein product [Rhizoctonia solani]|uniref:Uncharacterized protein n=1 Tax=Rhizoctonia solani TaxID=456999 RepID=A0A8H3HTR6_9AGAM|nr:unnamed protein product [Rhizoctonia solani]